jgi:hypothetical protein
VNANARRLDKLERAPAARSLPAIVIVSGDEGDRGAHALTMNSAPIPPSVLAELEREGRTLEGSS